MDSIIEEGKTVEEAIENALKKLNISRDKAEIKVLEEGSKGLLGFIGSKNAVVKVEPKVDAAAIGLDFLDSVLENIPVESSAEIEEEQSNEEQIMLNISSPDLGIIIGHRGETLDALQYLTSLVVNKATDSYCRVILDAEGYRDRRKQTLERLAKKLARKALSTGRKVMLEPMPPHERRIIHMTLRGDKRVTTYSEGKEPYRRVMIAAVDITDNN